MYHSDLKFLICRNRKITWICIFLKFKVSLKWPPLKTIYFPHWFFLEGSILLVFSAANHKSAAISHLMMQNQISFLFLWILMWPEWKFRARSLAWRMCLCSCWSPSKVCGTLYLGKIFLRKPYHLRRIFSCHKKRPPETAASLYSFLSVLFRL